MSKTFKIGAGLVLDGEKEYKQAISNVNKSMKDLDSQLKLTKSEFLGHENGLKSLRAQYSKQEEIVKAQKEKVEALKGALDNAKKTYGENSEQVQKWQISLNKATAEFNKQNHEFKELKKHASGLGAVKTGLNELKDKAHEVAEKTEKARKVLGALGKVSLKAIETSMKAATAAAGAVAAGAVAAGKGIWDMANKAAEAGNEIDKTSQKLGMSAEAYQEWDYVLGQSGVEITSMTTGLKTLTNQIDDAKNGTEKAQEKFAKLGISVDDLSKMSREDVFSAVITGMQKMKDSTERAALANDLFGKSGQNLTPLFNESVESTKKLKDAAHDLGFVMSNESVEASVKFEDSLDTLKRTATGVKNNLAAEFLPGFTTVIDGVTGLFAGDKGAVDKINKGVQQIADTFEKIRPRIEEILSTVIDVIAKLAPKLITTLLNGILSNLDPLLNAATSVLMTLVDGIVDNLDKILDAAFKIIEKLASALLEKNNLKKIINAAVNFLITMVTGVANHINMVIEAAVLIIDTVTEALTNKENMPKLLKAARDILVAIVKGLIKAIPNILTDLGKFLKALAEAFLSYDWKSVGLKIWEAIKNALTGQPLEVSAAVTTHVSDSGTEHGGGGRVPSHATGLYSVPYDGYVAELHKQERILTAEEARLYNSREQQNSRESSGSDEIRELRGEVQALRMFLQRGQLKTQTEISNTRDVRRMVTAANA